MIAAATLTGLVDLQTPDPATISLDAMAHGLGKLDRWAGALEVPFYVAQHSVLVADIFCRMAPGYRRYRLHALKHDGHEYVLGDIITPTTRLLSTFDDGFARRLDGLKARIDRAIEARFSLPPAPSEVVSLIAEADALAAGVEWRAFMPAANGPCPYPRPAFAVARPRALPWVAAADLFKAQFHQELAAKAWAA